MKYKVGKSKIEGEGLFTSKALKENELIGLAHLNNEPTEIVGKYHNHSDNPNAYSVKIKNKRFIYALRDLKPGEEITVDYRKQPELEQPESFKKGGEKKYTRDITATNFLNAEHSLTKKPKKNKKRIYSPNAKYYAEGGEAGCPPGYAFNPVTGECIEWNPTVWNSEEQSTSYDPVGDIIYMNPNDRPEGMSDEEYQQMYQDQIEHEQLHRLQWINDGLKGTSKTPLRMPSTADNQEYDGEHYYNRRTEEEAYLHDMFNQANPELARFIPSEVIYDKVINPSMYNIPWTEEGEARGYEGALHDGMESLFPKKQKGGIQDDKFKQRLMKRYPGMQEVYGPQGENLSIIKDPNYRASEYGYGDIEFIHPGDGKVTYSDDYQYQSPTPDKYTAVYNPKGANKGDIFLDMMHGMRDDQNYESLLQNFDKAVRNARSGDMQYYYDQDVAQGYTDGQEQWDQNYVDGQLRAQLAPGTLGMFSHGRKDYRKERRHDSPEMREAGKNIRNYIKGKYQNGGEATDEIIWAKDENDPIYQDYLIKKALYDYSNNPNFNLRSDATYELSEALRKKDLSRLKKFSESGFYDQLIEDAKGSRDYMLKEYGALNEHALQDYESRVLDPNRSWYGSPISYSNLSSEELRKDPNFQDENFALKEYLNDEFFSKYPPEYWTKQSTYDSYPFTQTYGTNENANYGSSNYWTKPNTLFIEDEVDRAALKKIYPNMPDSYIDEYIAEQRKEPNYITNSWDSKYNNYDHAQTYDEKDYEYNIPTPVKTFVDPNGLRGYLQDSVTDNITQDFDYLPYWSKPKEVMFMQEKIEPLRPEKIEIPKREIVGEYVKPEAPDYEPVDYKGKGIHGVYSYGHKNKKTITKFQPGRRSSIDNWIVTGYKSKPTKHLRGIGTHDRTKLVPAIVQKATGYNPKAMEGYEDEDGNWVPGEIEQAQQEGRRIEFDGLSSLADKKAQEQYNAEYDKYLMATKYPQMMLDGLINRTYTNDDLTRNKRQEGGQIYTYAGNPNASYQKIGNQWYISNKGTGNNFIPIKDPEGKRAAELNKNAVALFPGQPKPVETIRPVQGAPKPVINQTVWENAAGTSQKNAIAREKQLQGLKMSPKIADQELAKQIEWQKKQQALAYQTEQEAKWRNEQPLDMMDWLWGAAVVGPTIAPAAWTAAETVGAAAMPYLETAFSTSLPGMSGIAGATYGNALASGFAGDAIVNRLLPAPGKIQEGKYGEAAADITTGALDLWGANMLSPLYQGAKTTASELGRFIGTEEGLLSNAYKVNPFAFKPQEGMMYRGLGQEGFTDAMQSGVFRPKQFGYSPERSFTEIVSSPKQFESTFYTPSDKFGVVKGYGPKYVAEVPFEGNQFNRRYKRKNWSWSTPREIPIEEGRILQKDWLRGYKEVPVELPGSPNSFSIFPKQPIPLQGYNLSSGQAYKTLLPQEIVQEQKAISNIVKPVQEPWAMQSMPGLHLKSTMTDGPIFKIVEPKTGLVNVEQALGIIGKESGGADKVALIKQGLGDTIPKKMDFNEFRKVVQDQLIPLDRQVASQSNSAFGLERLGFSPMDSRVTTYGSDIDNLDDAKIIENQTINFSNKTKFGKGSDAHSNSPETLGHVHYFIDDHAPDALTITQIQSDAFQGPYRVMPKNAQDAERLEKQFETLKKLEARQAQGRALLEKQKAERLDVNGNPVDDYQLQYFEDMLDKDLETMLLQKGHLENINQKSLLDKNHQERYIQEVIDYAAKRGDINRIKLPTPETANKVQSYTGIETFSPEMKALRQKIIDASDSGNAEALIQAHKDYDVAMENARLNVQKAGKDILKYKKDLVKKLEQELGPKDVTVQTLKTEITILEKYKEYPKIIKKLYSVEPKMVTDSKGNTWYEFKIPYEFKDGPSEIKAFRYGGISSKLSKFIS